MILDLEKAEKSPRKLRTLLKDLPPDPDQKTVHQLRTQSRKLEALLHALSPDNSGKDQRILKLLKPLRRTAGRVRDMDVLIAKTSGLSSSTQSGMQSDGLVRLIGHMSAIRTVDAQRLHRKVGRRQKELRFLLKNLVRKLEDLQAPDHTGVPAGAESPQMLADKLENWPRLSRANLHAFRKGVKELRYMLQLIPEQDDHRLNPYSLVKDAVGDWHDWLGLRNMAESTLDHQQDAPLLREIRTILQQKFQAALDVANSLRRRGLKGCLDMPRAA